MRIIFLSILLCLASLSEFNAQNLVPNPSFEEYNECPSDMITDYRTPLVKHWETPTKGTADCYNSCSRFNVGVPTNVMGNAFAHEGSGYVGLILLERPEYWNFKEKKPLNYREYVQCTLSKPLIAHGLYQIRFFYCVAEYSNYFINRIGAVLSENKIHASNRGTMELIPTIAGDTIMNEIVTSAWYEVVDTIRAKGDEKYLTIGNFYKDVDTKFFVIDHSEVPASRKERIYQEAFAYYYIDDVSVVQIKKKSADNKLNVTNF